MEADFPCNVWWDSENGVAHNDWAAGAVCDLDAARRVTSTVADFGRGAVPVLVDMRYIARVDPAAREHFMSPEAQATAVALVVGSSVSKVIANLIIRFQRTPVPVRMFTNDTLAVRWLDAQGG